ncbi:MAG: hypothetical protein WC661_03585 [Opitutaceae bacterium]
MSQDWTQWQATDSEAAATKVCGRPVQALWPLLRPAFHWVFLEPHRRAGEGTVVWTWSSPRDPSRPEAADLAALRRALRNALLDLTDIIDRRDAMPAGIESRELRSSMNGIVNDLLMADDARMASHAVLTEFGWMIRSWGFDRPSRAMPVKTAAGMSENHPQSTAGAAVPPKPLRSRFRIRLPRWLATVFCLAALSAGIVWGARTFIWPSATPAPVAATGNAPTVSAPDSIHSPSPSARPPASKQQAPPRLSGADKTAPPPALVLHADDRATSSKGSASDRAEPSLESAAEPGVLVGTMPAMPERRDDAAGPASTLPGAAEPEPDMNHSGAPASPFTPSGSGPPPKQGAGSQRHAEGKDSADATGISSGPGAPGNSKFGAAQPAPAAVAPKDAPPGTTSTVAAKAPPKPGEIPAPASGATAPVSTRQTLPDDPDLSSDATPASADQRIATKSPAPPAATPPPNRVRPDQPSTAAPSLAPTQPSSGTSSHFPASTEETAGQTGDEVSADILPPANGWITTRFRVSAWNVRRAQDSVLSTWPSENTRAEILKTARAAAWTRARAMLPKTFRNPVVRVGWHFELAATAHDSAPPTWRDAATGQPLPASGLVAKEARDGWAGVVPVAQLDARLFSGDGRELARLKISPQARTIEISTGPEVRHSSPWFMVEMEPSEPAQGFDWKSRSPGWSEAAWETLRGERAVGLIAHDATQSPGRPSASVVALVHAASGWALTGELELLERFK